MESKRSNNLTAEGGEQRQQLQCSSGGTWCVNRTSPPPKANTEDGLGGRVLQAQLDRQNMDSMVYRKRICRALTVLVIAWLALLAVVASIVLVVLPESTGHTVASTEDVYRDIIKTTLPSVREWYSRLPSSTQGRLLPTDRVETTMEVGTDSCVMELFYQVLQVVNQTSPAYIKVVLLSLSLEDNPLVRMALHDLLSEPQNLTDWMLDTAHCYANLHTMEQLCQVYKSTSNELDTASNAQSRAVLYYFAHVLAVYETLTQQASTDSELLTTISNRMSDEEISRIKSYHRIPEMFETFATAKYQGMAKSLATFNRALATNQLPPGASLAMQMQINILEAVQLDAELGHEDNARVGLALTAPLQYGPTVQDHVASWRLGEDWVEAYLSWNLAFIVGSLSLHRMVKLVIPSVACTPFEQDGDGFITARVISLSLGLLHKFPSAEQLVSLKNEIPTQDLEEILAIEQPTPKHFKQELLQRRELSQAMGTSNLFNSRLASPTQQTVHRMFDELCQGDICEDHTWFRSSESRPLSDEDFGEYVVVVLWLTALLAGLGLELLFWCVLTKHGWTREWEDRWRLAQFLFPLMATTCLGLAAHENFVALLVLVAGLWKFAMPETISYMYMALYGPREPRVGPLNNLLNGVGTLLHHSAASAPIVLMLGNVVQVNRHILAPMLILVMQHWFVLLSYWNFAVYVLIELILEAVFEYIVLSELEELHNQHLGLAIAALSMLLAHWMYLIAAGLEIIFQPRRETPCPGQILAEPCQETEHVSLVEEIENVDACRALPRRPSGHN